MEGKNGTAIFGPEIMVAASNAAYREKAYAIMSGGSVCDGTADDVEINAALASTQKVALSSGTFNTTNPINQFPCTYFNSSFDMSKTRELCGQGFNTLINYTGVAYAIELNADGVGNAKTCNNHHLHDFYVKANSAVTGTGGTILLAAAAHCTFRNLMLETLYADLVYMRDNDYGSMCIINKFEDVKSSNQAYKGFVSTEDNAQVMLDSCEIRTLYRSVDFIGEDFNSIIWANNTEFASHGGGTCTNGTGICTGSPVWMRSTSAGSNVYTITVTQEGTFTVWLNCTGTATSGTGVTVTDSPKSLVCGNNTVTTTGTGTFTITLSGTGNLNISADNTTVTMVSCYNDDGVCDFINGCRLSIVGGNWPALNCSADIQWSIDNNVTNMGNTYQLQPRISGMPILMDFGKFAWDYNNITYTSPAGGDDSVKAVDATAAGGYVRQNPSGTTVDYVFWQEYGVYHYLPAGTYQLQIRLKDTNQVASDAYVRVRDYTLSSNLVSTYITLSSDWKIYTFTLVIPKTSLGSSIAISVYKNTTTDNIISADYFRIRYIGTAYDDFTVGGGSQFIQIPDSGTLPAASVMYRDIVANLRGGAGVADILKVCMKNNADAYVWAPITPTSGFTLSGVITTDEHAAIQLQPTLTTNHHYNGLTRSCTCSTTAHIAIGDVCYMNNAGTFDQAKADAYATATGQLVIATSAADHDGVTTFIGLLPGGYFYDTTQDFTIGGEVWISKATAGLMTKTQPATPAFLRCIGYGEDDVKTIFFNPASLVAEI